MKKLTFVVPVYNVENYLIRCLNSLINQNIPHSDYDIIIVNDGSTDNSLNLAISFAVDYSNIKMINQDNKGASAARNIGLKIANSKFIWFVDSDDFIAENCLKDLLNFAENENLEMFGVGPSIAYQNDFSTFFNDKTSVGNLQTGKQMLLNDDYVIGIWSYIFESEFLLKNKLAFMEGVYFEDEEFIPRALFFAQRIKMLLHFSVYAYITRPNSVTTTTSHKHIYDKLKVALSLQEFPTTIIDDKEEMLLNKYRKIKSDLYLSGLNSIIENKLKIEDYKLYLKEGKISGLYPIKFKSNRVKTILLHFFVNNFPKLYYIAKSKNNN